MEIFGKPLKTRVTRNRVTRIRVTRGLAVYKCGAIFPYTYLGSYIYVH